MWTVLCNCPLSSQTHGGHRGSMGEMSMVWCALHHLWKLLFKWTWSFSGCYWQAVQTAQGYICHLVCTIIQSIIPALLDSCIQEWMGLVQKSKASALHRIETERWVCAAASTVMWTRVPTASSLQDLRRSCCKEVQHGLWPTFVTECQKYLFPVWLQLLLWWNLTMMEMWQHLRRRKPSSVRSSVFRPETFAFSTAPASLPETTVSSWE